MVNGKRYIGSSENMRKRKLSHFSKLKCNYNENPLLQADYIKYGKEAFDFFVLELAPRWMLNEREQFWIAYYGSHKAGYNMTTSKRTDYPLARMRKRLSDSRIRRRISVA